MLTLLSKDSFSIEKIVILAILVTEKIFLESVFLFRMTEIYYNWRDISSLYKNAQECLLGINRNIEASKLKLDFSQRILAIHTFMPYPK